MKTVKPNTGVKGFDVVLSNLNKAIREIENRTMGGLIESARLIRVDMDETEPVIPVDLNNLRLSWHTEPFRKGAVWGLLMGFSANYAVFVHEMVDKSNKKINWTRKKSGPKFFEYAIKRNVGLIYKTIVDNVQIK
jgi:hypothetical protein